MTAEERDSCINGFGNLYEGTKDMVNDIPVRSSDVLKLQRQIHENLKMMQMLFGTLVNVVRAETKEAEAKNNKASLSTKEGSTDINSFGWF